MEVGEEEMVAQKNEGGFMRAWALLWQELEGWLGEGRGGVGIGSGECL